MVYGLSLIAANQFVVLVEKNQHNNKFSHKTIIEHSFFLFE